MPDTLPYYDCAVVGGGLAGLSLAAWLARSGYTAIVYEQKNYPFHKVCGEYLSLESVESLSDLGVPLDSWTLPRISKLELSSPDGTVLARTLRPGGIGISRHRLDSALAGAARANGAIVREATKVEDVRFNTHSFLIETTGGNSRAAVCCASFGRHANLDSRWKRNGTGTASAGYVGIKYHARLERPDDLIELHYFKDGYCGISPVEDGKHCICYLTSEKNLRESGNNIPRMEAEILSANPRLRRALSHAVMLSDRPVTVSQIGFAPKSRVENHVLMLGDAAGMIAPLCGNGMSMALHSSKLAMYPIMEYLQGRISRERMERVYLDRWASRFSGRMRVGKLIQSLFLQAGLANLMVRSLRPFPTAVDFMIRQTHGRAPF